MSESYLKFLAVIVAFVIIVLTGLHLGKDYYESQQHFILMHRLAADCEKAKGEPVLASTDTMQCQHYISPSEQEALAEKQYQFMQLQRQNALQPKP